jgi:hypothetical protein
MKWALIIDNVVRETTDKDPAGRFHESLVWIGCDEAVEPGWSHNAGIFAAPASSAPTLESIKAAKLHQLAAACQAEIYGGFVSSALGAPHTYPAKDKDQANLAGSVVASLLPGLPGNWTTPFWCSNAGGTWTFAAHSVSQIQQVGTDGKAAILAALTKNATLAAQAMAANTEAAVAAIVW